MPHTHWKLIEEYLMSVNFCDLKIYLKTQFLLKNDVTCLTPMLIITVLDQTF